MIEQEWLFLNNTPSPSCYNYATILFHVRTPTWCVSCAQIVPTLWMTDAWCLTRLLIDFYFNKSIQKCADGLATDGCAAHAGWVQSIYVLPSRYLSSGSPSRWMACHFFCSLSPLTQLQITIINDFWESCQIKPAQLVTLRLKSCKIRTLRVD